MNEQTSPKCRCPRFRDTGGYVIADLACPVHGVNGTNLGDWTEPGSVPRAVTELPAGTRVLTGNSAVGVLTVDRTYHEPADSAYPATVEVDVRCGPRADIWDMRLFADLLGAESAQFLSLDPRRYRLYFVATAVVNIEAPAAGESPRPVDLGGHVTRIDGPDSCGHWSWSCDVGLCPAGASGFELAAEVTEAATGHGPLAADSKIPDDSATA